MSEQSDDDSERQRGGDAAVVEATRSDADIPWYVLYLRYLALYWKSVLIVCLIVVLLIGLLFGALGLSVPRSRDLLVSVLVFVAVSPYARWLAKTTKKLLWHAGYVYGVALQAEDPDEGGIWRWPVTTAQYNRVTEGEVDWCHQGLLFARSISERDDADLGLDLEGTWRGTLQDRKLAWSLSQVAQCRGQLLEDAARGHLIENAMWVTVFEASRRSVAELRDMMEDGTLPDRGDGLDKAVARSISDVGLDDLVDTTRDDLDLPDSWETGDFSDPLGQHDYDDEAVEKSEEIQEDSDVEVDVDVEFPEREGFADD